MNKLRTSDLIRKYYLKYPSTHQLLLEHCRMVTRKALSIARFLAKSTALDLNFIAEAAMLHDIGMLFTYAPDLYCFGDLPYLAHGIKELIIAVLERGVVVLQELALLFLQVFHLPHQELPCVKGKRGP